MLENNDKTKETMGVIIIPNTPTYIKINNTGIPNLDNSLYFALATGDKKTLMTLDPSNGGIGNRLNTAKTTQPQM